jgi:hypothetical protein
MEPQPAGTVVLRPFRHLLRRGVVAAVVLGAPLFGVLYWATAAYGDWTKVLAVQATAMFLVALAIIGYSRTNIRLGTGWIRERGFFGRVTTLLHDEVRTILLLDVYQTSTLETKPQLFVLDADGRPLLRLRGEFWPVEDMQAVAEHLEVPITRRSGAATLAELRRTSPELLYWFERFPRLTRS